MVFYIARGWRTVCLDFGGTCAKAFLAAGAYGHGPVDPNGVRWVIGIAVLLFDDRTITMNRVSIA